MKSWPVQYLVPLLAAVMLAATPAAAQEEIELILINESIEAAIKNSSILSDDPSLTDSQYGMGTQHESDEEEGDGEGAAVGAAAMPIYVGAEVAINPTTRSLTLPVATRYRKTDIGLKLPFIFSRSMDYAGGTASASGVGDISLSVGRWFPVGNYMLYPEVMIKLPTGDAEATDGGYLVPLGSGSTDFALGVGSIFDVFRGKLRAKMQFRSNGSDTRVAEYTLNSITYQSEYKIHNGNLFLINGEYAQPVTPLVSGFGGLSLLFGGDGETEFTRTDQTNGTEIASGSFSNEQGMTLVDLFLGARTMMSGVRLSGTLVLPIVTSRSEFSRGGGRSISMRLGASYSF